MRNVRRINNCHIIRFPLKEQYHLRVLEHASDQEETNPTFMKKGAVFNTQIARLTAENAHLRKSLDDIEVRAQADAFLIGFAENEVMHRGKTSQ
jgi:hypothetical protein